jgi:hypothetical protein
MFSVKKEEISGIINIKQVPLLILFISSVFFSVLSSRNAQASFYAFLHLVLYVCFFLYVLQNFEHKKDFSKVVKIFSLSVFLLSLLAFAQWYKQGSLFNNYLFLGEQPYSFSTYNVNRENFFGFTKIPAYGLFRHPNIFGGFLSVVLLWLLLFIPENKFVTLTFIFGLTALFLTLSISSLAVFLLGFCFLPPRASLLLQHFVVCLLPLSTLVIYL